MDTDDANLVGDHCVVCKKEILLAERAVVGGEEFKHVHEACIPKAVEIIQEALSSVFGLLTDVLNAIPELNEFEREQLKKAIWDAQRRAQ